jgi:hypothetical protein
MRGASFGLLLISGLSNTASGFQNMPGDVHREIAQHLSHKEKAHLRAMSKNLHEEIEQGQMYRCPTVREIAAAQEGADMPSDLQRKEAAKPIISLASKVLKVDLEDLAGEAEQQSAQVVDLNEHFPPNFLTLLKAFRQLNSNNPAPFFRVMKEHEAEGMSHILKSIVLRALEHPEREWWADRDKAMDMSRDNALTETNAYDCFVYAMTLAFSNYTKSLPVNTYMAKAVDMGFLGLLAFGPSCETFKIPKEMVERTRNKLERDKGKSIADSIQHALAREASLDRQEFCIHLPTAEEVISSQGEKERQIGPYTWKVDNCNDKGTPQPLKKVVLYRSIGHIECTYGNSIFDLTIKNENLLKSLQIVPFLIGSISIEGKGKITETAIGCMYDCTGATDIVCKVRNY